MGEQTQSFTLELKDEHKRIDKRADNKHNRKNPIFKTQKALKGTHTTGK